MIQYGLELHEWKTAQTAADEMLAEAHGDKCIALAHFEAGIVLLNEGRDKHKDELFTRAHDEFTKALTSFSNFPEACLADGKALAQLKQDAAAKVEFEKYVQMKPVGEPERQRALRYISEPELARARMAPPFAIDTLDGQHISMDDLAGKVVLIDFWATWCGPCREEMPSIQALYDEFSHEPDFVVLAVSEDSAGRGAVDSYVHGNAFRFDVLLDPQNLVGDAYDVSGIPETFIIDRTGRIVAHHVGPYDWSKAEMRQALRELIDVKEKETAKAG